MLKKVLFKNKEFYLLEGSNINLLNYEPNREIADFLNNMHSNSFALHPDDNIFLIDFNEVDEATISGNLIGDISGHHAQFLIAPKFLENDPNKVTLGESFKNFKNKIFKNNLLKTG